MSSQDKKTDFAAYINGLTDSKSNNNAKIAAFIDAVVSDVCGQICEEIKEKITVQAKRNSYTMCGDSKKFAGNYTIPSRKEGVGEYSPDYSIEEINSYMKTEYPGVGYSADGLCAELIFKDVVEEQKKNYVIKDGGKKIINKVKALAGEHGIVIEEGISHTLTVDISDDSRKTSQSVLLKYEFIV